MASDKPIWGLAHGGRIPHIWFRDLSSRYVSRFVALCRDDLRPNQGIGWAFRKQPDNLCRHCVKLLAKRTLSQESKSNG